jgi:hypothetical protein
LGHRQRSFALRRHGPTTPASYHTARGASRLYHIPHRTTLGITGAALSNNPHEIRLRTTSRPHNEHSYHRSTTGSQHHGRSNHTSTTSSCTMETGTRHVQLCRLESGKSEVPTTLPRWPNALALSCAAPIDREGSRVETSSQNRSDLVDAKRRQLQRLVGRHGVCLYGLRYYAAWRSASWIGCGKSIGIKYAAG